MYQIHWKVPVDHYHSVLGLMDSHDWAHRMIVSFLLYWIHFYLFGFRPSSNGVGTGFYHPPYCIPLEVEFPHASNSAKGYCMVPIGGGTFEFVQALTWQDCVMLAFSFSIVSHLQSQRLLPEVGNIVTAVCYPAGLQPLYIVGSH